MAVVRSCCLEQRRCYWLQNVEMFSAKCSASFVGKLTIMTSLLWLLLVIVACRNMKSVWSDFGSTIFVALITTSYFRLGLPNCLFTSGFPTKTLYARLIIHAICPAYPILLDLVTRIVFDEEFRSWSYSLCSFLRYLLTFSFSGTNIFLVTLFSNTLSICSSVNVEDHVPYPYQTTGKIVVLFVLLFIVLNNKLEDSRSQWRRGLRRRRAAARLMRLCVRIPPGHGCYVFCECCVLSGRGPWVGLIIRPEESYLLWCVVVCDLETSTLSRLWPTEGCCATTKKTWRQNILHRVTASITRRHWLTRILIATS
jgi:hypothetical protein